MSNKLNKKIETESWFKQFDKKDILILWNECITLEEIASKLVNSKFITKTNGFTINDYKYIHSILTRENWSLYINKNKKRQKQRHKDIYQILSKIKLLSILEINQIENLSHLSIHFLMSYKHGRNVFRTIIKDFGIQSKLNSKLYKSVYGISKTPSIWPKKLYEKRIGPKPSICSYCGFKASNSKQIELHHIDQINIGSKNKRTQKYFSSTVHPILIVIVYNIDVEII